MKRVLSLSICLVFNVLFVSYRVMGGIDTQTITATDLIKTYGDPDFDPGATASSGLAVSYTSADNSIAEVVSGKIRIKKAGMVTIRASQAGNGSFAAAADVTFTLIINKAALTVTANDDEKIYDGLAYKSGNGVTYAGFVNGEDGSVLSGTLTYTGTSQGAINVDFYTITPTGLTAVNYTITYVSGTLSVYLKWLQIWANDEVWNYDGVPYAGGNGVRYVGFVNGEDESVLIGTLAYAGTSQGATAPGTYYIVPHGLTAKNYTIAWGLGYLVIQQGVVTVTAGNAERCYNAADPAFTVTYSGFLNNETSAILSTQAVVNTTVTATSAAGDYALVPSGATSDHYTFRYVNGTYTIHPLPVTTITTPDGAVLCGDNSAVKLTATGAYADAWSDGSSGNTDLVSAPGTYSLIATDAYGCTAPAANSVKITTGKLPVPAFSYERSCTDTAVTFINTTAGDMNYVWTTSDGQSSTATSPSISFAKAGTYTVTLTATADACPNDPVTTSQEIAVESVITNTRLNTVTAAVGVPVQLHARVLSGASYEWSPATGLSDRDVYNPVATLSSGRRYYINMSFTSGCTATDTLDVVVPNSQLFVVANAFTPNKDGLNDVLHVGLRGVETLEYFEVYDRWGRLVFRTSNAGDGWDGFNCGVGTYVWAAQGRDYTGQLVKQSGTVILIR